MPLFINGSKSLAPSVFTRAMKRFFGGGGRQSNERSEEDSWASNVELNLRTLISKKINQYCYLLSIDSDLTGQ